MEFTFLGTGSAIPIPRVQPDGSIHDCPQCRSNDPRDRRWPTSLLIDGRILIDAPPQIIDLLQSQGIDHGKIEHVVLTHRHSDAAGGLNRFGKGAHLAFPARPGVIRVGPHHLEAIQVPHDPRTWGYLIDEALAYFSDYSNITPALAALRRAKVAILDGSGWDSAFPTHQPMREIIPVVKELGNLEKIYFTHNGHTKIPHAELEKKLRSIADERFAIVSHGLSVTI